MATEPLKINDFHWFSYMFDMTAFMQCWFQLGQEDARVGLMFDQVGDQLTQSKPQVEPKLALVGSKTAQMVLTDGPWTTKDGHRTTKDDPRTSQEVLGTKSMGAGMHRGGTREAPGRHQGCTEDAPGEQLAIIMGPRAAHIKIFYLERSDGRGLI